MTILKKMHQEIEYLKAADRKKTEILIGKIIIHTEDMVILTDTEKQLTSFKELSENRLKEIEQLKMKLENTHHTDDGSIPHSSYYIYSLSVSSYEQMEKGIIS